MSVTLTVSSSFFFLLLIFSISSAIDSEIRCLLEFKKGFQSDPLNKVLSSWKRDSLSLSSACPSFYGVACDGDSGTVVGVSLDGLEMSGDLKFSTLLGLRSLQNLSLSGNRFTGRLVPALGSISSLQRLDLSDNEFYGPIPARIEDLWNLNYLNLSKNKFTGDFPVGSPFGFRNLQQLKILDLHLNQLEGDIGEVISQLRNVELVDLSYNQFYGGLGVEAEKVSSLANTVHFMNFSHNDLTGGFLKSEAIDLFRSLEVLDLGDNRISGELPSLAPLSKLRILKLARNQLMGPVPEELLESSTQLQELDLSGNGFSGTIPEVNSSTLNVLNLSSNGLSGSLPAGFRSCVVVDLSRNMFSGNISVVLNWEQQSLMFLDLSSNQLTGSFPDMSSQFEELSTLNFRNNSLSGPFPSQLNSFAKLASLDLSLNQLSGSIPNSLFSSMNLMYLNLSRNHFTGPIPLQGSSSMSLLASTSYPPMQFLDLSSNSLTGVLPSFIGNIGKLVVLNLANNDLSGQLPSELSKLSFLKVLDLSGNKFEGEIPNKLSPGLEQLNVSNNNLSGNVPENLRKFPTSSFHPGNPSLKDTSVNPRANPLIPAKENHHKTRGNTKVAIIVASVGAAMMIVFVLLVYHRAKITKIHGRSRFSSQTERDAKVGRFAQPTSMSFSNTHLLTSNSRSLSRQAEFTTEIVEQKSAPSSPLSTSPRLIETIEQPVMLDVYSPDRLVGELFFLDSSLALTAEELSRAPAEILGRSSHGTLYKAKLDSGYMLTVKWLRVGLVRHKKDFSKEVKKIGSVRHPNIVSLRAYYWGPKEQERLLLADYIHGNSLTLHLYESTPSRHPTLTFSQRLKVAVDVAQSLLYLHDRGLTHGNLKPTNIVLALPDYSARLTDYSLHRLMTPAGVAEQILNLGALGYCAPELSASSSKPVPSYKTDVYAFGVILMELLTRRSAGDIISGQSGAVDLTDWVRLCDQEGRGLDCIDRDITGGEENSKGMDDLLAISLRCILPVNERPNIRQVVDQLRSISA